MTVIYLTEYNTICYGVTFENNGCIKVQNSKDRSNQENKLFRVKPLEMFLGKNGVCDMTLMSGASDNRYLMEKILLKEVRKMIDIGIYISVEI